MSDRVIGILGGMGPEATADLFLEITRLTPARCDQEHLRIIAYSNPRIPDRTAAILHAGADPVPELIESARLLERAGAEVIAIPCNSAHFFLPAIRAAVRAEGLDMIGETLGLKEFLRDPALSGDATEDEVEFLGKLMFRERRPTPLYYYRELQNPRDPLHFRAQNSQVKRRGDAERPRRPSNRSR